MSRAVVQFVEMVRQAAARNYLEERGAAPDRGLETRMLYCQACGANTPHSLEAHGLDEVYRCCQCNMGQWFRVR